MIGAFGDGVLASIACFAILGVLRSSQRRSWGLYDWGMNVACLWVALVILRFLV